MFGVKQLIKIAKEQIIKHTEKQPEGELVLSLEDVNSYIKEDGYELIITNIEDPIYIIEALLTLRKIK